MIFTFSGASGAGKTTIVKEILGKFSGAEMVVSDTTRASRDSDLPGEYMYRNAKDFETIAGSCLWTLDIHGNCYGTREESVAIAKLYPDKIFIMLLTPATIEILKAYAEKAGIRTISIYIISPKEEELRRRLWKRTNEDLASKLKVDLMAMVAIARMIGNDLTKSPEDIINEVSEKHDDRFKKAYDDIEERIKSCKSWDEKAERNSHLYEYSVTNGGPIEKTVEKVAGIIRQNRP